MTAIRVEVPPGVASPVWLAHIVRNALARALHDQLADPLSLRVEPEPGVATLNHGEARRANEGPW